jgi:4a-hydroxytetrahydrobiopterin dehydratase
MESLSQQHCEACRRDAPRVTGDEARALSAQIPEWQLVSDEGIDKLSREFEFSNFLEAFGFAGQVATLAEAEQHHPMLVTEWGRVRVVWWTHKIKGLHRNDFIMAARTDELFASVRRSA